jgi:hypothetical protein
MDSIDHDYFINHWVERAEREEEAKVDFADRFISLWIAFNGWMKKQFGVNKREWKLIIKVKEDEKLNDIFEKLSHSDSSFQAELKDLKRISIVDMRGESGDDIKFDGTFGEYIASIYRIRCNLFHGSKSTEDVDRKLINIAYKTLLPIFKKRF